MHGEYQDITRKLQLNFKFAPVLLDKGNRLWIGGIPFLVFLPHVGDDLFDEVQRIEGIAVNQLLELAFLIDDLKKVGGWR